MTKTVNLHLQPVCPACSSSCSYLYSLHSTLHGISFPPRGSLNFHLILRERFKIFQQPHTLKWHLSSSVARLHCDARHGDLWERGVPLLAVLQPAGLRAVGAQCQRGGAHLQLPFSVQQLHSDGTEDVDGLVKTQINSCLLLCLECFLLVYIGSGIKSLSVQGHFGL